VTGRGIGFDSAEKRLHLLVRQDIDGIHQQLPGLVRQVWSTTGASPDWARLLTDLASWRVKRDHITKAWLQAFYRTASPDTDTDTDVRGADGATDDPTPVKDQP
jgi:CRISPR system Cascade subunit CasB